MVEPFENPLASFENDSIPVSERNGHSNTTDAKRDKAGSSELQNAKINAENATEPKPEIQTEETAIRQPAALETYLIISSIKSEPHAPAEGTIPLAHWEALRANAREL